MIHRQLSIKENGLGSNVIVQVNLFGHESIVQRHCKIMCNRQEIFSRYENITHLKIICLNMYCFMLTKFSGIMTSAVFLTIRNSILVTNGEQ
jgi:hypothetical protein